MEKNFEILRLSGVKQRDAGSGIGISRSLHLYFIGIQRDAMEDCPAFFGKSGIPYLPAVIPQSEFGRLGEIAMSFLSQRDKQVGHPSGHVRLGFSGGLWRCTWLLREEEAWPRQAQHLGRGKQQNRA